MHWNYGQSKCWRQLVTKARGYSNISPSAKQVPHKAARLLGHLGSRGASVTMHTPPWSSERKAQAFNRGSHKSSHGEREFVSEKMMNFCRQGYWLVLPQDVVSDWPNLRILPLGVVPQRGRRPRLVVDYSLSNVNGKTVQLAPKEAMQFGHALQRMCTIIVHANRQYGSVHLAEMDIADGFYCVWIQIDDVPKRGGGCTPHISWFPTLGCLPFGATSGVGVVPPLFHGPDRNSMRHGKSDH